MQQIRRFLFHSIFIIAPFFLVGEQVNDESGVNKLNQEYLESFNKHDAKGLSSHWLEDANFKNPITGNTVRGREAIAREIASWFEERKVNTAQIKSTNISFPDANSAIETGVFRISFQDNKPENEKAFRAELVKKDNQWFFKEIQQVDIEPETTNYSHLKELEWLIGSWVNVGDNVKVQANTLWWDKYKNYLAQMYTIQVFNQTTLEAQQIIGWDPIKKELRSWVFDTDGGFGEGKWYKKGPSWFVDTKYTLADGRKGSAIHIYTKTDDNSFTWASEGRDLNGEILPNIEPITIVRKNAQGVK